MNQSFNYQKETDSENPYNELALKQAEAKILVSLLVKKGIITEKEYIDEAIDYVDKNSKDEEFKSFVKKHMQNYFNE